MGLTRVSLLKRVFEEQGQTLVMTVFCMAVLLGALGLAVDVGVLLHTRRQMQAAADAAAMAGATELFYNGNNYTNIKAKATTAAQDNLSNAGKTINVDLTVSPTLNPGGISCPSCVQVAVSTPNPTIFMSTVNQWMFKATDFNTINVSAMATAGAPGTSKYCMYVMDPDDPDTLWIQGAGKINAPGCGVYVNSDKDSALCVTGSAGKSTVSNIDVVGAQDGKGNCKGDPGAPVNTGVKPQTPAIANQGLPDHPEDNCNSGNTFDLTASGGTLSGDLRSSPQTAGYKNYVCFKNQTCTKGKKPTCTDAPVDLGGGTTTQLGPGIYVFETGVTVSGNTTVGTGNNSKTNPQTNANGGATIVVTGTGAFDSSTASNFSIWAPAETGYAYNAVAIYQPSADTQDMMLQFGSSSSYFNGAIYAPTTSVTLHDQGGAVNATDLIVGSIHVNGTVNLTNYSSFNPLTTPFKKITLVE